MDSRPDSKDSSEHKQSQNEAQMNQAEKERIMNVMHSLDEDIAQAEEAKAQALSDAAANIGSENFDKHIDVAKQVEQAKYHLERQKMEQQANLDELTKQDAPDSTDTNVPSSDTPQNVPQSYKPGTHPEHLPLEEGEPIDERPIREGHIRHRPGSIEGGG